VRDPLPIALTDRPVTGSPRLPGSKSITNRALVLAALADGSSELRGALFSDDTRVMMAALERLGIGVVADERSGRVVVSGCAGVLPAHGVDLDVGNSGTSARFLAAVVALGRGEFRIDGSARMRQRPIEPLALALRSLGVDAATVNGDGCPPLLVKTTGLKSGRALVESALSSQYLSGLLLAAPHADGPVVLAVRGELASEPYVAMTLAMLDDWGIQADTATTTGVREYCVPAPQAVASRRYDIEPDASAASYFLAAAAITQGHVLIEGLGHGSLQGDVRFARVLESAGCTLRMERDRMELWGPGQLRGVEVDMNDISDTLMTLAAIAPFASGPSRIRNVAHVRAKESDRIRALATELRRVGIRATEHQDGLTIYPGRPHGAVIRTYDDHRIAMSFATMGLRVPGIAIQNPGCVAKTFPGYFGELDRLTRGL